jgi:hypothetical protein
MPFPALLLWGAAAVGAAVVGKKIYDAVTDDDSTTTTSDEDEVKQQFQDEQREEQHKEHIMALQNLRDHICTKYDAIYLPSTDAFELKNNSEVKEYDKLMGQINELKNLKRKLKKFAD